MLSSPYKTLLFAPAVALLLLISTPGSATDQPEIFPVSEVRPGMHCVAYTIFSGDKIEKMDADVVGVLYNAFGPKLDIVIIQLLGEKPEHTGVVAGMSGSPVYIDGKLLGALSLKLGIFNKEAIAGVTPIANMLDIENQLGTPANPASSTAQALHSAESAAAMGSSSAGSGHDFNSPLSAPLARVTLPADLSDRYGLARGNYLLPIETPLIFSGFSAQTLAQYAGQLSALGLTAMAGGTTEPSADESKIAPGDMVGMDLVRGDLSLSAGCTVTVIRDNRVFACGHPLFGLGKVSLPLSRGHVVLTLASSMASTKIMNSGGVIGTLTQDRTSAVMGELGPGPPMIPMDVELHTPNSQKAYHFEVIDNPQLTPLLVAIATFNGVTSNVSYTEGSTLQFTGKIDLKDHTSVQLEDLFAPTDVPVPSGIYVALAVQAAFARLFQNPFEPPHIEGIHIHVTSVPERRRATIDSAWSEKIEAAPGETIGIKVLLQPYRGSPFIQEIPITIPPQTGRGNIGLLISDADTLNRVEQSYPMAQPQLTGLDELIGMLNRERHNDRLYATLLQPTPTLLIEDKEMPNVPLSELNILDQRQSAGAGRLLGQSTAGEWAIDMNQVITGQHYLTITVK
ncbi:MAG: hypothetical protein WB869_09800 [Candidatus Acidiferrales bacterium]